MGRYLIIGIIDQIYIEKKEKFRREEEKQELFQSISNTIDLSYYNGEEDREENVWLFTLKKELLNEYLDDFVEETLEMIKQYSSKNTWMSFDKKSLFDHLVKINSNITEETKEELENIHYLHDDCWPDREYTEAFLNKENKNLQDIMIYPRFIVLCMSFNKTPEEEKELLRNLSSFAHHNDKNPLGKCFMFYIVEKNDIKSIK